MKSKQLPLDFSVDVNECSTSNPCKNGATCVNNVGGYQCLCVPGYTGIHCDTGILNHVLVCD